MLPIARRAVALSILGATCLLPPPPAEAARAPVGRNYMVLEVEHLEWPPTLMTRQSCLRFRKDEVCDERDRCGEFVVNERTDAGNSWWGLLDRRDAGDPVELVLVGSTAAAGSRSSIGGTIIFTGQGTSNGAFVGQEASRKRCLEFALGAPEPVPDPVPTPDPPDCTPPGSCCRICSTGKACGDTCISRSFTCRRPRGCACNASDVCPSAVSTWLPLGAEGGPP